MNEIQGYKCPCCSAPLLFEAQSQNLHCNSCGNDFSVETMQQLGEANAIEQKPSKYDWDSYEPRDYTEEDMANLSGYSCPSCGAEITGDATLGATMCPYCGNATIIQQQFSGTLMPDYLIPFRIDKKTAMQKFEEACLKAPFLPNEFKDQRKIQEMAGIYIPFWMFDCDCNADISYHGERMQAWSDAKYNYVKTDFYKLLRSGSISFANIPVDGSQKAEDDYMDAIEPFDYNDAVNFNTAYLSGFLADKYDVSAEESIERANTRVKNSTEAAFKETTSGYAGVITEHSSINFSNGKIRYSLLPVWMLNIKYQDQMYKYAINGQTGKVVGKYPVSKKKKWWFFTKVYAVSLAVCAFGFWAYMKLF